MKLDPINLIGGFYQDDNLPWSAQDTVNWIPRPAEMPGTISQMKLVGAPGLSFLADIDDDPVRIGGFRNVEGRMFIVAGTTLYELNTDLTTTVRGTIPGAGPVTMAHNQLEFGNELCIGNGSGTLYVWNTWTNTFTVVTDDAATGSIQSVYLNRRIIHLDPFGRFGYPSDIDSATSYDSLDRFDSEASPDKFVGLGVSQFELVGISQRTTEFYSDTGATEQPFRPKRIAINRGCAARNSIVQLGGTLAMLGDDGIFYRLQGYQWEPISTGPVNKAIEGNNWANCFGFVYEDRKHEIAYWTFPDGQTWGYDAWTGLIHRRESFGLNRWRINAIEKWNDMWIAGDFQSGRIYRIDWEAYHEAGQPLVARRVAPPIYNNGNKVVCPMIELVFDTGRGRYPPISISGDLPDGFAGDPVTYSYTASGGVPPYTFSIISGALPTGLTMDASGEVSGTVTAAGTYSWVVGVEDSVGQTATLVDGAVFIGYWSASDRTVNANGQMVLSNSTRTAQPASTQVVGTFFGVRAELSRNSGRRYVEFFVNSDNTTFDSFVGLAQSSLSMTQAQGAFAKAGSLGRRFTDQYSVTSTNTVQSGVNITTGDRIGVLIDFSISRCWMHVNGTYISGNPTTLPNGLLNTATPAGPLFPIFTSDDNNSQAGSQVTIRLKQSEMQFFPTGFAGSPFLAWGE